MASDIVPSVVDDGVETVSTGIVVNILLIMVKYLVGG
jgi:hypothetical protein